MLEADEDGRILFLHNELLLCIFKCKWKRETGPLFSVINKFTENTCVQNISDNKDAINKNLVE